MLRSFSLGARMKTPAKIFAKIEQQKADLLAQISPWSPARLTHCPAPGQWSVAQMLDHLVKVESEITAAAKRGWNRPQRIRLRDRVGFLFLDQLFRTRVRVKVPVSAPQVLPARDLQVSAVCQRWCDVRTEIAALISLATADQLQRGIFRHPVSGWMSLPQLLSFFSVHIRHHRAQLERLAAASEGL
jgi:uncharacterized damage-inducible protein DinB